MQEALLWVVIGLLLLISLGVWFVLYQVIRQQGRLLLRLDRLERGSKFGVDADETEREPMGLREGEPLPSFSLPGLAGKNVTSGDFAGRRVLLVNWNPDCGFCDLIASDLARVVPDLRNRKTELVLASYGSAKRIRSFNGDHGLEGTVLLQEHSDLEAFQGLGTPVAYLLDEDGRVAKPLAVGADEVLELAHDAGGGRRKLGAERSFDESKIEREGLKRGALAPAFTLPAVDDGTVSLDDFRGRKVLLVFSDPVCGPCQDLTPELAQLDRQHLGDELQILMVGRGALGENRRKARKHGVEFPVVVQNRWKLSKEYGIFATPVAFLIDEQGVIAEDVAVGPEQILALARQRTDSVSIGAD